MFARKLVFVLMLTLILLGLPSIMQPPAYAGEDIQECIDNGGNLIECAIAVFQCHIFHHCTEDGDPL